MNPYLRVALGGRYEDAIIAVDTFSLVRTEAEIAANTVEGVNDESFFLPAGTLTWNFFEDMQLRLGYSQTITRPQFRELAPSLFTNPENDEQFFGNPFLKNTEIENYDARLEWYFARDQFLTLGAFYKDMQFPIEEVLQVAGDDVRRTSFFNAPASSLYGFEVEFERIFELSNWHSWEHLDSKDFIVRTNYTWSQSEVDANGPVPVNVGSPLNPVVDPNGDVSGIIVDGRSMQGQSEHLFNIQLGYEDFEARSRATFLVNFTGERIRQAENLAQQLPAIVERPPTMVDFLYAREFDFRGGTWELGFRAANLLDDEYEAVMEAGNGVVNIDTYNIGQTYEVTFKLRY